MVAHGQYHHRLEHQPPGFVLRMPAGSNPSYLTAVQLAAVHELVEVA